MDPVSVLTLIGNGLNLVDRFYDLTKKIRGEDPGRHSVNIESEAERLIVDENGYRQEVRAEDLNLSNFDKVRHDTLKKRIDINWARYNRLDVQRATAAADEKVRLEIQMDELRNELCPDFKELVGMYERILGRGLPDHYTLYDICGNG